MSASLKSLSSPFSTTVLAAPVYGQRVSFVRISLPRKLLLTQAPFPKVAVDGFVTAFWGVVQLVHHAHVGILARIVAVLADAVGCCCGEGVEAF